MIYVTKRTAVLLAWGLVSGALTWLETALRSTAKQEIDFV